MIAAEGLWLKVRSLLWRELWLLDCNSGRRRFAAGFVVEHCHACLA